MSSFFETGWGQGLVSVVFLVLLVALYLLLYASALDSLSATVFDISFLA